jgi:predicted small lipoprotein YifL
MLGLGACGVKGPLEPPPDAEPSEVRTPGARSAPPAEGEAPSEPFVLDRLLI